MRRKVLDAQANPGDANIDERVSQRFRDITRIELECMFAQSRKIETSIELRHEIAQPADSENRGSPSTPVEMNDLTASRMVSDKVDFSGQLLDVSLDWFQSARSLCVASTVKAHLFVKRHV